MVPESEPKLFAYRQVAVLVHKSHEIFSRRDHLLRNYLNTHKIMKVGIILLQVGRYIVLVTCVQEKVSETWACLKARKALRQKIPSQLSRKPLICRISGSLRTVSRNVGTKATGEFKRRTTRGQCFPGNNPITSTGKRIGDKGWCGRYPYFLNLLWNTALEFYHSG